MRWTVEYRSEAKMFWELRCPYCVFTMIEPDETLERLGWPQHPWTAPNAAKPVLRCQSCGQTPHLPGPSDLAADLKEPHL